MRGLETPLIFSRSIAVRSFLPSFARGAGGSGFAVAGCACDIEMDARTTSAGKPKMNKRENFMGSLQGYSSRRDEMFIDIQKENLGKLRRSAMCDFPIWLR